MGLFGFGRKKEKRPAEEPPYDFVALDFETATQHWSSACSLGLAFVRNLQVVSTEHFLIQPPGNRYDQTNIGIHGIYPEDTENAPPFAFVWAFVAPMLRGGPLVAHNAPFDMTVLRASLDAGGIPYPASMLAFQYVDTIQMVREFKDGSRKLADCAEHFGICLDHHHNAECDAIACAELAIRCLREAKCRTLAEFCKSRSHVQIGMLAAVTPASTAEIRAPSPGRRKPAYNTIRPKDVTPRCTSFDEAHPLYMKSIVFTGELSISRKDAMQLAADVGALIKSSVSRKTDYLVVGKQDVSLVGDDGLSSKEEKAYALIEEGKADIKIIGEQEYLHLIGKKE